MPDQASPGTVRPSSGDPAVVGTDLHVLFPLISTAALIYALVYSFIPFPASPFSYAPLIDGLWLLLGILVLVAMRARGSEQWLLTAGAALGETGDTESDRAVHTA